MILSTMTATERPNLEPDERKFIKFSTDFLTSIKPEVAAIPKQREFMGIRRFQPHTAPKQRR